MSKVLVVFALKEEFAPWRRRHRFRPLPGSIHPISVASFGQTQACVGLAGAGAPDAQHFDRILTQFVPSHAVVTGLAAGLNPQWRSGDVVVAVSVSDPEGRLIFPCAQNLVELAVRCGAKPAATLITLPHIARLPEEKAYLAHRGDAADMESLIFLKQWSARAIPALAVRVILDPVEMPITCDFETAMDAHGQVRIAKIISQVARDPRCLPDFLHLARKSRHCLTRLAGFLDRYFHDLEKL